MRRWEESHLMEDYVNWHAGEPTENWGGVDEDCVWTEWNKGGSQRWGWIDTTCDTVAYDPHALCEYDCTKV